MKETIIELLKANAGPLVFIIIAGLLCLALPSTESVKAIYLFIGAALTRVKRVR